MYSREGFRGAGTRSRRLLLKGHRYLKLHPPGRLEPFHFLTDFTPCAAVVVAGATC